MRSLLILLLWAPALALAGPPCPFAGDGVCDEPAQCALGTDAADCDAACAQPEPEPTLFGACRFRAGVQALEPPVSDDETARGSFGSGGPRGWSFHRLSAQAEDGRGQVERLFKLYVPRRYDPARPAPLVIYAGGFGDDMHQQAYTDLNRLAELEGVLVAYSQQLYRDFGPRGYRHAWYVYNPAFAGDWPALPDLDYYRRLIDHVAARYNLDRTRVITTGTSRGAGLSVMLAFLAPDTFSGFVSQAGFATVNEFDRYIAAYTGRQVPGVIVHGLLDDNVVPAEGIALRDQLEALGWGEAGRLQSHILELVGHQWQPQLTHRWWPFLYAQPIPLDEVRR
ncbi:MAG: hypothetical protein KC613_18655 [Myxococcales bacterium]|nr:hypothetical protein [Myxococcales bacterium]